jgi:hypothetical protein
MGEDEYFFFLHFSEKIFQRHDPLNIVSHHFHACKYQCHIKMKFIRKRKYIGTSLDEVAFRMGNNSRG